MLKSSLSLTTAPAQMFTVPTLRAIQTWWQNNGFISTRTRVCAGLEFQENCPAVCINHPAHPAQPVQGHRGMPTAAALEEEDSAVPCPLHSSSALHGHICASGHIEAGIRVIIPQAHTDERSSKQRDLRVPGAGLAQLSITGPGWKPACVDITYVWECWWLTHSSSMSCSLLSQSLAASGGGTLQPIKK